MQKKNELDNKLEVFKECMAREIKLNEVHKPEFLTCGLSVHEIIGELEYHKAKALVAARCNNKIALREYLADVANYLLLLGDYYEVFDK